MPEHYRYFAVSASLRSGLLVANRFGGVWTKYFFLEVYRLHAQFGQTRFSAGVALNKTIRFPTVVLNMILQLTRELMHCDVWGPQAFRSQASCIAQTWCGP